MVGLTKLLGWACVTTPGNWSPAIKSRAAWLKLVCLGLLAVLAGPFFAGRVYTADDLGAFHLPLRDFYARQLAAGEAFDWMPSLYCGFYLTGEGQVGSYHPLHWLLYRCLPLGAAFDVELLLSYPCLLAGTYLLLRRLVRRPDAAQFGALSFTFSGFCLLHFVHPNAVAVVAHLPWLLWAIDLAVEASSGRRRAPALTAVALLTGSQLLLGYPQYVWFSLLTEAAFAGWRLIERGDRSKAASLLAAKVCGLLLGAQQWLPTADAVRQSTRVADAAFANTGSLHPLNLLQCIAPYLLRTRVVGQNTHELGLYCGAVPLLLCAWLLSNRPAWGRYAPLVKAALACGTFGFAFALGEHGWLYSLQGYLPLVNRFRFPCRAIVLIHLAVAVLAAVGWARLTANPRGDMRQRPTALWLTCCASVALALIGPLLWPDFTAVPLYVWSGPALVCLAAWLLFAAMHGRNWAIYALALLAAVDLGVYGLSAGAFRETADLNTFAAAAPLPPRTGNLMAEGNNPIAVGAGKRIVSSPAQSRYRAGDRWLLAGFELADGYAGLEPHKRLDYHADKVLRVAGVDRVPAAAAESRPATTDQTWRKIERPLARARLLSRVRPGPLEADLASLDVDRAAVVEPCEDRPADAWSALPESTPGDARVLAERAGYIEVSTDAPATQLLVLNESFDRGWWAAVDGQPVTVLRINGDFLGCLAPAGRHRVAWEFHPWSRWAGGVLSGCGLSLLVMLICGCWVRGALTKPSLPAPAR